MITPEEAQEKARKYKKELFQKQCDALEQYIDTWLSKYYMGRPLRLLRGDLFDAQLKWRDSHQKHILDLYSKHWDIEVEDKFMNTGTERIMTFSKPSTL